jgi:hypothetical protein
MASSHALREVAAHYPAADCLERLEYYLKGQRYAVAQTYVVEVIMTLTRIGKCNLAQAKKDLIRLGVPARALTYPVS